GLFGLIREYTFEEYNADDIKRHLEAEQVPLRIQQQIVGLWDTDRPAALRTLQPYLRRLRVRQAEIRLSKARNAAYLNELYFPDEVIRALDDIFGKMHSWVVAAESPEAARHVKRCTREELQASLEALHECLRTFVMIRASSVPESTGALVTRVLPTASDAEADA